MADLYSQNVSFADMLIFVSVFMSFLSIGNTVNLTQE